MMTITDDTPIDITRLAGESEEETIIRVCQHKDEIGTWPEVAAVLNKLLGHSYNESAYRKKYQAYERLMTTSAAKEQERLAAFVDEDTLAEIEEQRKLLRKERMKLQTANLERTRYDREEARHEMYYEYIGQVVETLPMPEFHARPERAPMDDMEYVLTLADIHYGACYDSRNNSYTPAIAKARMELLAEDVIKFCLDNQVPNIKVLSLGDSIQGLLRPSDLKLNDSSVVKAVVEVSRLIAQFLNEVSAYVEIEYLHVPSANHSQTRPLGSKAGVLADEDLEYVISNYIKDMMAFNDHVVVTLAPEGDQYLDMEVNGWKCVTGHGHTIKSKKNALKNLSILRRNNYDYLIIGHLHGGDMTTSFEGLTNDCETIVAPSFIGSDPYSDSLCCGAKSASLMLGFDAVYGHTFTKKFILSEAVAYDKTA